MLDEKREFQEYLYEFGTTDTPAKRIKYGTFLKRETRTESFQYNGLERFLTVIARGLLDDAREAFGDLPLPEKGFLATAGQMLWMGMAVEASNEKEQELLDWMKGKYPFIEQWLKNYLENVLIPDRKEKNDEKKIPLIYRCIEDLSDKAKKLGRDSIGKKVTNEGAKTFTYGDVTYNALLRGPLKVYALCCRTSGFADIRKRIPEKRDPETNSVIKQQDWKDRLRKTEEDIILKLTAACLLEMRRAEFADQGKARFVPVNFKELTNWAKGDSVLQSQKFKDYFYHGMPLFEFKTLANNQSKVKLNQEWLSACGLLDITEGMQPAEAYREAHPGDTVYLDGGSGPIVKMV